ncbi:MAG: DUF2284 domain-containing protein [Promethearchaeota archaeon]
MPVIKISLKDIIFDPKVQTYCNNPRFRCPNYSHSWACPPEAPYMESEVSQFDRFFLIYYIFNLKKYIQQIKLMNPQKSEDSIRKSFYRKDIIRDNLEKEIWNFLDTYQEYYDDKLILWDGYCRLCYKENKICTYVQNIPCRYPNKIRYSMEAVGIDVDKTVKNINIKIEWPPVNNAYRFGLICFK